MPSIDPYAAGRGISNFSQQAVTAGRQFFQQSSNKFQESIEDGVVMQAVFGYSGNAMTEMFDIAHQFLEHGQLEEAAEVYLWLIYLNPYVAWFWEGLGDCWHRAEQWEAALYAYCVAINCDLHEPRLYRSACQCCMDMGNYKKARELLLRGSELLKQASKEVPIKENKDLLHHALAYVETRERSGR